MDDGRHDDDGEGKAGRVVGKIVKALAMLIGIVALMAILGFGLVLGACFFSGRR
jgi:hypothetical protein